MAWYDFLVDEKAKNDVLQNVQNPIDFSALGPAAGEGVVDALTNPQTYMNAVGLVPGAPKLGGPFPGVNSIRNQAPNWVRGEAGKGGRSWRWGADGPPSGGGTNQVRVIPQQKGGLPATQGGLPATQGGLPAVRSNTLPATIAAPPGAAAASSAKPMPLWLKALTAGTAGYTGYNMLDDEPVGAEPGLPPQIPSMGRSQSGGFDMNALLAALGDRGGIQGVDFETLPQVDYDGGPQVDRDVALAALESTRPEAPAERSWMQDLGDYVIPALAGGILGGLPGLVIGGLMGGGNVESKDQARDAEYQEAMNRFDRALTERGLELSEADRKEYLDTELAKQQQELQNWEFQDLQEGSAMEESQFLDQGRNSDITAAGGLMDIANAGQMMDLRSQMMSMPGQTDSSDVFNQLLNVAPGVYSTIQNDPDFAAYKLAMQTDDEITASAMISNIVQRLSQDPQYGPVVQQLQQQMQQQQMMQNLQ